MFSNILFPIDIEDDEEDLVAALNQVVKLARSDHAKLTIVTIIPNYGSDTLVQYFPKNWLQNLKNDYITKMNELTKDLDYMDISIIVRYGHIYRTVLDIADEIKSDIIAVQAHTNDSHEYLLGPNAAKIVRHAKISVLVLRSNV